MYATAQIKPKNTFDKPFLSFHKTVSLKIKHKNDIKIPEMTKSW